MTPVIIKGLIPHQYFRFKATGESKYTWHAGSYHDCLYKCNIHECNIMIYSSIMASDSEEIDQPNLIPAQELKTIISRMDGRYGERIAAGIAFVPLYNDDDTIHLKLVVERAGNFDEDSLREVLRDSLYELYSKTFSQLKEINEEEIEYITKSFVPEDVYGTVIVGLAFVNFKVIE
jgi:pyruvoyl-dependent arginine decarboxylase (PvlArgDC)